MTKTQGRLLHVHGLLCIALIQSHLQLRKTQTSQDNFVLTIEFFFSIFVRYLQIYLTFTSKGKREGVFFLFISKPCSKSLKTNSVEAPGTERKDGLSTAELR